MSLSLYSLRRLPKWGEVMLDLPICNDLDGSRWWSLGIGHSLVWKQWDPHPHPHPHPATYIHIHPQLHTHTYIHTYIAYMHSCVHICTYMHAYIHTYIRWNWMTRAIARAFTQSALSLPLFFFRLLCVWIIIISLGRRTGKPNSKLSLLTHQSSPQSFPPFWIVLLMDGPCQPRKKHGSISICAKVEEAKISTYNKRE